MTLQGRERAFGGFRLGLQILVRACQVGEEQLTLTAIPT